MAITRVNGLGPLAGNLVALNSSLHVIQVANASSVAQDLSTEDNAVDETVEAILKEVNPLAYFVADNTSGNIYVVTDKNVSSSDLQHRIRTIGADSAPTRTSATTFTYATTSVGPNDYDISGTTVTTATTLTLAI